MRDNIYRGKQKGKNRWLYGHLTKHYSSSSAYTEIAPHIQFYNKEGHFEEWEVIPESVGQFTGQFGTVMGKPNNLIFEGDIQREEVEESGGDVRFYYVCRYMPEIAAFVWMDYGDTCTDWRTAKEEYPISLQFDEHYHICGNEFDNPDWWQKD